MMCIHNTLARALETLELLDHKGQHEFLVMAALETGGYFHTPETSNNWDCQRFEIKAHNVYAEGDSREDAIRNWRRAARNEARLFEALLAAENTVLHPETQPDTEALAEAIDLVLSGECRSAEAILAARALLAEMQGAA